MLGCWGRVQWQVQLASTTLQVSNSWWLLATEATIGTRDRIQCQCCVLRTTLVGPGTCSCYKHPHKHEWST